MGCGKPRIEQRPLEGTRSLLNVNQHEVLALQTPVIRPRAMLAPALPVVLRS